MSHCGAGLCSKKGNGTGEGSKAQVLRGTAEGNRVVQSGEKKAEKTSLSTNT